MATLTAAPGTIGAGVGARAGRGEAIHRLPPGVAVCVAAALPIFPLWHVMLALSMGAAWRTH